jgi:hypothetical protein
MPEGFTRVGFTLGRPDVVEVNPGTGARTLISGNGRGSGPALQIPASIRVEASGDILVTDVDAATGTPQLLRIDPATGNRMVLTGNGAGSGPPVNVAAVGLENGVTYVTDVLAGEIMSVNPVTGARTLISGPTRGTGLGFVSPVSMTSDSPGSLGVCRATGNRALMSSDASPTGGQQFDTPIDVQYNACEKAFYVLQTGFTPAAPAGRVLKVDAATGARTLFASYLGAENYALLLRPIPVALP